MGKPNFFGSHTLCSFAPVATGAMFILALTIYSFVTKRKLTLYGSVSILLLIIGFTGFWIYNAKIPMDSIQMNITNVRFWIGEEPHWISGNPANVSSIYFNVTLYNPSSQDIPAFHTENPAMRINDKFIDMYDVEIWDVEIRLYEPLKAYSMIRINMRVRFNQKFIDPDVWASLLNKNFTFTISGVLIVRYYYAPSDISEYDRRLYSIVWASKPYSLSYTYQG